MWFIGVYIGGDKDNLTVFTIIGGIDSPKEKLDELKKLGDIE